MTTLGSAFIDRARRHLTDRTDRIKHCVDQLSDEQVWWRPHPKSNSVGNLVLHTCGSTRHFLGRGLGGSSYRRERPREFAEKGLPRPQLLAVLEETVAEAERVLGALDPARLLEVTDRAGEPQTALAILLRTAHHWGVHTGQIVFATKALKEGAFDDLWMKTMR